MKSFPTAVPSTEGVLRLDTRSLAQRETRRLPFGKLAVLALLISFSCSVALAAEFHVPTRALTDSRGWSKILKGCLDSRDLGDDAISGALTAHDAGIRLEPDPAVSLRPPSSSRPTSPPGLHLQNRAPPQPIAA